MEHSVQAYLERRSSEELVGFLETCANMDGWARYEHEIPQIFDILESRNFSVPEQIKSSWQSFCGQ